MRIFYSRIYQTFVYLLCAGLFVFQSSANAGAYIFAGEDNGINLVTHPPTFNGNGGTLTIRVCINPTSPNAVLMEGPVQSNINTFNQLVPTTNNLISNVTGNSPRIDFESVSLHEIGHCLGMAHVNAATESGLPNQFRNYTKATDGPDDTFYLDPGPDGIIGSKDDIRGDDVNLHWFKKSDNNPFTIASRVDSTTYSVNTADLPAGHSFAANGDRSVAGQLLGSNSTEAVMQQGTGYNEAQRTLTHDDVATLRYGQSGLNESSGPGRTNDDYTIQLVYGGISSTNCDISMGFTDTTGLAFCAVNGGIFNNPNNHAVITSANIEFGQGFLWHFSSDTDNDGLTDDYETNILGTDAYNADTDGDGLVDGSGAFLPINDLSGGIDTDNDGFVDGESDFSTNPLISNIGDVGPLDAPDGQLNAADLIIMTRLVTGDLTAGVLQDVLGDMNGDSTIDVADLLLLQQQVLAP